MFGAGLLGLKRGEWAWRTASMLALSDVLIENCSFEARDYLERLIEHRDHCSYAPNAAAMSPGNMTALALSRFEQFGELMALEQAGVQPTNGFLARLAPVAVRHWKRLEVMAEIAERQARTTHSGAGVERLSRSFAEAIGMAIGGHSKEAVLSCRFGEEQWGRTLTFGELRQVLQKRIRSDQGAQASFDAAFWCVATGGGFEGALCQARNLGGNAMSIGAMAGQLAGAIYGAGAIRRDWLECLAGRDRIEAAASQLFEAGMMEA
jgi:ADP-ribosyl-[dinitrogen reductase] hydrolase